MTQYQRDNKSGKLFTANENPVSTKGKYDDDSKTVLWNDSSTSGRIRDLVPRLVLLLKRQRRDIPLPLSNRNESRKDEERKNPAKNKRYLYPFSVFSFFCRAGGLSYVCPFERVREFSIGSVPYNLFRLR